MKLQEFFFDICGHHCIDLPPGTKILSISGPRPELKGTNKGDKCVIVALVPVEPDPEAEPVNVNIYTVETGRGLDDEHAYHHGSMMIGQTSYHFFTDLLPDEEFEPTATF